MRESKKFSFVKLKAETMAKIEAIAAAREKLDQETRTKPVLVTQLVNAAYDAEVLRK